MIAVIDCGTNTFNLIIAEADASGHLVFRYNDKISVKLGEGGIDKQLIADAAFARGVAAMVQHKKTIDAYGVTQVVAIGTAALRDATNGNAFIETCYAQTGIDIELVDGNREAELIWTGARHCVPLQGKFMVMDIGGGSNEFIIGDAETIYWKKSYRLGVSRLKEKFGQDATRHEMDAYLQTELAELFDQCQAYGITQMVGTAGSFDTYANVLSMAHTGQPFDAGQLMYTFNVPELTDWCAQFIKASPAVRNSTPGIAEFRKEFMPYSCTLTHLVLTQCHIQYCYLSTYSLKEGVALSLLEK